jgi:hypothetical protein
MRTRIARGFASTIAFQPRPQPSRTRGVKCGLLSFSHAGLAQLLQKPIAAVQQLRGELPEALTVPDARVALATNGGAGALFCDVLLLGKEPA